jgi:type I restriction enzyme S subunit
VNKVREGYKMTELGEIPEDWNTVELDKIIECGRTISYGVLKPGDYTESGVPLIRIVDIRDNKINGSISGFHRISKELDHQYRKTKLEGNEILISLVGTVGNIAVAEQEHIGMNVHRNIGIIPIDEKKSIKQFGAYCLQSNIIQKNIKAKTIGSNQPLLNLEDVREIKVFYPPLREQQEIALILSSLDEQIENTDKLIEKTKELKKGLMQRLLTKGIAHDRFKDTEIGKIPEEWEVRKLKDVFKVSSGNFLSQKNVVQGEYPVYGGNGITSYHNEYLFENSKIVIGRVGAKCGCVCVSEPKSWITDNALFIADKITEFEDSYMFYLLSYMNLNQYANQNAQPVISGQKIYELSIAIPSVIEQRKIVHLLLALDEKIEQYETKKERLQELKKGLMQKLLTGKIRVKV